MRGSIRALSTALWGDTVGAFSGGRWQPADGSADITDVFACVGRFGNAPNSPPLAWCDMEPVIPDGAINIVDILHIVSGFLGEPHPFAVPCE